MQPPRFTPPKGQFGAPGRGRVVLVMGVTGSGKSSVGEALAERLGARFVDADAYHSASNVAKMSRGESLTEVDRAPWLAALRQVVERALGGGEQLVLACSALRESYRQQIRVDPRRVPVIYLKGSAALIADRLRQRVGHFATESLLAGQFTVLEEPRDAFVADVTVPIEQIVDESASWLSS